MRSILTASLATALVVTTAFWAEAQEAPAPETESEAPQGTQDEPATETADYDAATVIATVNGTEITLGHAVLLRQRLPEQYQGVPDDVLMPGLIEQLVDQAVLADALSQSPESDPLAVTLHLENERRGTLAARAVQGLVSDVTDETALQEAYEAATAAFTPQTEYNASHILVDSEEKANELKAELDGGADFAALAAEHSSDGSAQAGGSLGWFGPGQMVAEFETAVAELEPGDVAGPVETQFGWHLIKLDETRSSEAPTLETLRPELEAQVRQQALQTELERLRSEATIELPETMLPASAISDASILEN